MNNIGINGAHDASVTFTDKFGNVRIFEFERFSKIKNAHLSFHWNIPERNNADKQTIYDFYALIKSEISSADIDTCYYNELTDVDMRIINEFFNIKSYQKEAHHSGHARWAIHQSPFDKSIVISFDGGGTDKYDVISYFNIFIYENKHLHQINQINLNFGTAYSKIALLISEIPYSYNMNLYSGKLMGLSSYGNVRNEWIEPLMEYYKNNDLKKLCEKINIQYGQDVISHTLSYDLAASSQYVFEKLFNNVIDPILKKYPQYPTCLTGACALNVINNNKLKNKIGEQNIFIPPNPNDSGLSLGYFLHNTIDKQINNLNITYSGIDIQNLYLIHDTNNKISSKTIANKLISGEIIGIIHGKSECGPRALGHRSILCYPNNPKLKEILNSKIKFREWFRPFAPVTLETHVGLFFNNISNSPYMSFCPAINKKYEYKFPSITHIDNSSRVQTVTRNSCEVLYDILLEINKLKFDPILLNTSFNIQGKPIINDVNDAINIKKSIPIDTIIINNNML